MRRMIEALDSRGRGIAGGAALPRVLPGEEVDAEGRILTPSPDRVRPPCPHYRGCGGCSLQHARDDFVARWKQEVIRKALAQRGLAAPIRAISTSPPRSRRRATLHGRRLKKGAIVGFHAAAAAHLSEIPNCHLLPRAFLALLQPLRDLTAQIASRREEVDFALTLSDAGVDLDIRARGGDFATLADFATRAGLARLSFNGDPVVTLRPPKQRFGDAFVLPPPGAFLQATEAGQSDLVEAVREVVGPGARLVDLFAGCGTFTLPLSARAEIHAVEADAAMLDALAAGWRAATGLKRVTTEARDLFRRPLLADELARFDAVILDPPRAGAEAQCREISGSDIGKIAYVSCNPVSFARDTAILHDAGFTLDWVQPVDQFRWSAHVELVSQLSR